MDSHSLRKIETPAVHVVRSPGPIVERERIATAISLPNIRRHGSLDRNIAILLAIAATAVIAVAGFVVDVDSTSPIRGYIDAQQGMILVQVQGAGVLSRWLVKQGESVRRGQSIGVVTKEKVGSGQISILPKTIELLQKQRATIESGIAELSDFLKDDASSYAAVIKELDSQGALVSDAYEAKKNEINISSERLIRAEGLVKEGYISRESLEDKRSAKLRVDAEALVILQQLRALRVSSAQAKQGLLTRRASTLSQISSLKRTLADIDREGSQYSVDNNFDIVAPADGVIGTLTVPEGNYVEPSRSVATIVNSNSAYIARVVVPPKGIGQIDVGARVTLYLDAFPYRQYGHISGTVSQIDMTYVSPKDQVGPVTLAEPAYYASIKLSSDEAENALRRRLRPGMLFDTHVATRQYSVFGWLGNRLFHLQ